MNRLSHLVIASCAAAVATAFPATAAADPPQATVQPEIFVDATTVACTPGVWTNSPNTVEYVIVRDETVQLTIPTVNNLYTITDADRGHRLACAVKVANVFGEIGYAISPSVAIPAAAPTPTPGNPGPGTNPVPGTTPAPGNPPPTPGPVALSAALSPAGGQKLAAALKKGVRVTATCSQSCDMTVKLRKGRKVLGSATKTISGGSAPIVVKFPKSAARSLRSAKKVALTLEYTATAGGERQTGSAPLLLKR